MFFAWKYQQELKKQLTAYCQKTNVIPENDIEELKTEKNDRKRSAQDLCTNVKKMRYNLKEK